MKYTLLPIKKNCETSVNTVEEEVSSHLGYFIVSFRLKMTEVRPRDVGTTVHQDGI